MVVRRLGDGVAVPPVRVGDILMTDTASNPSNTYTGTTWQQVCVGRVPVGVNTSDSDFNTINKQGGAKTHTLTTSQIPSHTHTGSSKNAGTHNHLDNFYSIGSANGGFIKEVTGLAVGSAWSDVGIGRSYNRTAVANNGEHSHTITIGNSGGGTAHNNLQPYQTKYFWKRLS